MVDSRTVAKISGRSVRWVQDQVSRGRLTPAEVIRGGGCRVSFQFRAADVVRQLTEMGVMVAIDQQVRIFLLGLARNDRKLAHALWMVICDGADHAYAARVVDMDVGRLRAMVGRYRADVEAFVEDRMAGAVGSVHETHE